MTRKELISELLKLGPQERMQAAEELWESVADIPDGPFALSTEQEREIKRRLDEHDRDPSTAIPWDVVRARLWSRFE